MRAFVLSLASLTALALAACSSPSTVHVDAAQGAIDAPDTIDAPAGTFSCANYCATIATNCIGANVQYASAADCMNTCSHFPMGTAADTSGNTLGCRIYHAGVAAGDPNFHCTHAGPGGNAYCGTNCESFCALVLAECTGGNTQYNGNPDTCLVACNGYAAAPTYSSTVQSGNNFACRLYHATAASTAPGTHCLHTAATGPVNNFPCVP